MDMKDYTINDHITLYKSCNMITIISNGEVKGFEEQCEWFLF